VSRLIFALLALFFAAGCSNLRYEYQYVPGKTASLMEGRATAPDGAPDQVHAAIAAANQIAGSAYTYGGGHGAAADTSFDCSGATSHVLRAAGLLRIDGFSQLWQIGGGRVDQCLGAQRACLSRDRWSAVRYGLARPGERSALDDEKPAGAAVCDPASGWVVGRLVFRLSRHLAAFGALMVIPSSVEDVDYRVRLIARERLTNRGQFSCRRCALRRRRRDGRRSLR
jgi:hypothetical protein